MADMKFKFTIQPYQTEAVNSVVGVFAGQPYHDRFTYRRDVQIKRDVTNWKIPDEELYMGFANAKVQLDFGQLLKNINGIQARSNIKLSQTVASGGLGACYLDVEMETGTGKTYVYIKTMFELNKQYGGSKFIVVVPSIVLSVRASARALIPCRSISWSIMERRQELLYMTLKIWQRLIILAKVQILAS